MSLRLRVLLPFVLCGGIFCLTAAPVHAQNFRFTLRAEPDVIPANGLSTTSIFVQLPQGRAAITPVSTVRFATTAGSIESQATLSGGVARVLLRSATTPGTATVTAFIGNARETMTVEFSEDTGLRERYLEVAAPYVAYGNGTNLITSSGKTVLDFGDLHVESDVRVDVDLATERLWAQGNKGGVLIRNKTKGGTVELTGDRLFYDLRKRQGVMRRSEGDTSNGPNSARQEFVGSKFEAPSPNLPTVETPLSSPPTVGGKPSILPSESAPTSSPQGRENLAAGASNLLTPPAVQKPTTDDKQPTLDEKSSTNETKVKEENQSPTSLEKDAPADVANKGNGNVTKADSQLFVPGSLADNPAPLQNESERTLANPLFTEPKPSPDAPPLRGGAPDYAPLPTLGKGIEPRIVELSPPTFDATAGYWVSSRRLRVFPRDKVQFERASVYFNGKKAFGAPLYVLPLDGSFNPQTDIFSFNSSGGLGVEFPFYYQASKRGTGAVFFRNSMGGGFDALSSGPSLEVQQQYWLNSRSHGKFSIDQIGHGDFNINFQHEQQIDRRTNSTFYFNMPRHRDIFARASVARDFAQMQIGFEGFFDRPEDELGNLRGQFFARMKPKMLGKSGWNYTLSANALAVQRVTINGSIDDGSGGGGGVGLPGRGGGGIGVPGSVDLTGDGTTTAATRYRSLTGQTINASFQSPTYAPWRGAQFGANLLATGFNYSDGRRGFAPGANLSFAQALGNKANFALTYTYDRSNIGLYGATSDSFTHYFTANLNASITPKLAFSSFASRSLSDKSLYGSAGLDYYFSQRWRAGAFVDYANFSSGTSRSFNYGWSLARSIAGRELSLNYDATRGKVYVSIGNASY